MTSINLHTKFCYEFTKSLAHFRSFSRSAGLEGHSLQGNKENVSCGSCCGFIIGNGWRLLTQHNEVSFIRKHCPQARKPKYWQAYIFLHDQKPGVSVSQTVEQYSFQVLLSGRGWCVQELRPCLEFAICVHEHFWLY